MLKRKHDKIINIMQLRFFVSKGRAARKRLTRGR